MSKYNSTGEGFSSKAKSAPMGMPEDEKNEKKQARANRSTKVRVGKASKEVAKTKRKITNKTNNMPMNGRNRTVLRDDLKKAL